MQVDLLQNTGLTDVPVNSPYKRINILKILNAPTISTPDKPGISITLPESFVGKRVEVIAFTIEETMGDFAEAHDTKTHFYSEAVLSKDWLTPEEDKAWQKQTCFSLCRLTFN